MHHWIERAHHILCCQALDHKRQAIFVQLYLSPKEYRQEKCWMSVRKIWEKTQKAYEATMLFGDLEEKKHVAHLSKGEKKRFH